jgi:hypothetical protein
MTADVVAFAPRPRKAPPALTCAEVRLTETYGLQMTVLDEAGNTFLLSYRLMAVSPEFDLSRLVEAWVGWRGSGARAS